MIFKLKMSSAIFTSVEISEITNVADFRVGTTMNLSMRVEVRTGGLTAFNQITFKNNLMSGFVKIF